MNRLPLFLLAVVGVLIPNTCDAVSLAGSAILRSSNIETFDPSTFGPGPNIDVYELIVSNHNDGDVTSIELDLCFAAGTLQNFGNRTFSSDSVLPLLGPNTVADSYLVVSNELAVDVVDTDSRLRAAYTTSDGGVLVPANSEALVAVLSIPAGASINLLRNPWGRAAIDGQFENIGYLIDAFDHCVPEPSTALLLLLALSGVACRRDTK